jgi:hypothetical protein
MNRFGAAFLLVPLLAACPTSRTIDPRDGSTDSTTPVDARPPRDAAPDSDRPPLIPADSVDLLFMIDNSNDMAEQQTALAMQLPRLFIELAARYDSINAGVVTSDMGSGGFAVPTCRESNFGDDGVLRTSGNTAISGCNATYPPFLSFNPSTDEPRAFANEVSCVAVTGTGGCGFEQPLEAILKAVTPSTQGPSGRFDGTFSMGTVGHADGANAGFLRPDADLAIVLLTKEEDCSALDPELFNPSSSVYSGDLNLRCFSFPGAVQPFERYADGLTAGRDARRIHFLPIVGVPDEAAGSDFEAILAHPDMQEMIDPSMPTRLRPSCNIPGIGFAFPPRRIVEVGRLLDAEGASVSIQSICQADFTPAIDALITLLR